jgi:hypothetical protein
MGQKLNPRRLARVSTVIVMDPARVGPLTHEYTPKEIQELVEQGLTGEIVGKVSAERAPFTHLVKLDGPRGQAGTHVLAELDIGSEASAHAPLR